jgi:ubiquinone/menaquinone biosynthesis C-methylase UbiE
METQVDWNSYSHVYDLMAENNPAYQEILSRFSGELNNWDLPPGSTLCDLGSGTGNFSLALATAFPGCRILHVDSDRSMNEVALRKSRMLQVSNLEFKLQDMEHLALPAHSLSAITSVHALYPLCQPQPLIKRLYDWLQPGGYLFICDIGRVLDVNDWAKYLFAESMRKHGLTHTLRLFSRGRAVARHNRQISQRQRAGAYWTHSLQEFLSVFVEADFEIVSSEEVYRGYSDLIIARKQPTA